MSHPKVSVIIVNYNGESVLRRCFHSIANQDWPRDRLQIIVVDNASTDGSVAYMRQAWNGVEVVEAGGNLGYSGGANVGWARSDGDYVALMANDMFFPPNWINDMVSSIESRNDAAVVTTAMVNGDDFNLDGGEWLNASPVLVGRTDTTGTGYTAVPWGGACLIRKNLFSKPFDADYFLYGEDIYLGLLSWLRGYKVVANPTKVAHLGSVIIGFGSPTQVYYNERNRLTNLLLFFKFPTLLLLSPLVLSDIVIKSVFFLAHGQVKLAGSVLRAIWWNLRKFGSNLAKRRDVQAQRRITDHALLDVLCENVYGTGTLKGVLNVFATGYFRLVKSVCKSFDL
jgi:hypothetical protein